MPVPPTPSDLATVLPWPDEPTTDGWVARGQRTRRHVADGLIALLREGDPELTARSVARRADVSLRLVFHHFAELDDLYAYVAALEFRRQWSAMPHLARAGAAHAPAGSAAPLAAGARAAAGRRSVNASRGSVRTPAHMPIGR